MPERSWQFFIDVGGTFTDVIALPPGGTVRTMKLLSTGAIRGTTGERSTPRTIVDPSRIGDPEDIWVGYALTLQGTATSVTPTRNDPPQECGTGSPPMECGTGFQPVVSSSSIVTRFDSATGTIELQRDLAETPALGASYQLSSGEDAPVTAIRYLMARRLDQPIGPIEVRLGTTRATNALLERKGARTALVTTHGFADVLRIGNQDRPRLFELNIRKRGELTARVVEIDQRIGPQGNVIRPLNEDQAQRVLRELADSGIESLAICLLHAHVNPQHEETLAGIAASIGFRHVSVSSRVSRLERIVSRGDTTVVDSYLSPIIHEYVRSIRTSLPEARFTLMTSAGGLVKAESASGKDTLLSGPAGGVVGCVFVARRDRDEYGKAELVGGTPQKEKAHEFGMTAQAEACGSGGVRVIGFDMGGTSTDVSRYDSTEGGFEYQHETVTAGVRIMTPMLAVETVAAGGGSICAFDGQMLTVGPHSAGADPGPACYGRGGPLTVTDMNVLLGHVPPEHFPFPLDVQAINRRVDELRQQMASSLGAAPIAIELAEGFLRIADDHMASAIKRISVAKGYDPRDYTLVAFGGAGAQHACAVARLLGISRVLLGPMAGVLSALGIGAAGMKEIRQQSHRGILDHDATARLNDALATLEADARRSLHDQGVGEDQVGPPARSVDLCYEGEASHISVPHGRIDEMRTRFEALHRQHYGYAHDNRSIEVGVVRVEIVAPGRDPTLPHPMPTNDATPSPFSTIKAVFDGQATSVPLFRRDELRAGHEITGPAIVVEAVSTVVIAPGWTARMTALGDLELHGVENEAAAQHISSKIDPIRLELFHNQFASIAEQMGSTLRRTALSTNVKERLDFSCALFTPTGDLVANAPHIPVHLGGMGECISALIQDVGTFSPGDVYVTNDPYRGGSHLNDVTVITPVHDENGSLMFFVGSRAHHAEIGGTRPGSMPPDSKTLADEGVLIRAMPYIAGGCVCEDALREALTSGPYPSRAPDENLADIAAQAAANRTGERELRKMVERFGIDVVQAYMVHIQAAAANKMQAALRKLAPGTVRCSSAMDSGAKIDLAVTIEEGRAVLDFSGTDPVTSDNLNANRAIVTSATLYCLRCLIDSDIPLNAGVLEPVTIVLPECFLNPRGSPDPTQCPAVAAGNVETSQRIVDVIFGALGTVAASQGTMNNVLIGDDTFGYYETICGGAGAGPNFHGASAVHTHMTNTRLTDPEVLESRYPMRVIRFAIRTDSGGDGRYRGGEGVVREIEFLAPLDLSIISNRRTTQPFGLCGGGPGASGRNELIRAVDGSRIDLGPTAQVTVAPGDRLIVSTPGGGGYGKSQ